MTWGQPRTFPRAIVHVDGDSFFASCEIAKDPSLRGKPVITGKERGIVSACTYEAKAAGVMRGMQLHEAKKVCPEAVILPSDYESYSLFSERMYAIVRRYTPMVEEYSIDECFADLTGMRRTLRMPYAQMVARIQEDLERELGMTFSIGLSATKVLAKLGSRTNKPHGLTIIPLTEREKFLAKIPAGHVWGIGPNSAAYLAKFGIRSALDFANKNEAWVRSTVSKPLFELWQELNGESVLELDGQPRETYQSISKTKTFTPPSTDASFIYAQLSKNVENACIKARRWNLAAPAIFFFLKTQEFKFHGCEIRLPHPSAVPHDMLREIATYFPRVFKKGVLYRATGITLLKLGDAGTAQLDLFGAVQRSEGLSQVFESVDGIAEKYGKHSVFLGSSFKAMQFGAPARPGDPGRSGGHLGERLPAQAGGDMPARAGELFKGETKRRRLNIPTLGEVS